MSATVNPTSNNPATSIMSPTGPDASAGPVAYMSPDNVIEYVESTLSNIDGQLTDFQNAAMEKNKTANEWRDYKKLVREYTDKDQTQFPSEQPARAQEIARVKAEFAELENSADPELRSAALDLEKKVLPPNPDQPFPAGANYAAYADTPDGRSAAEVDYQKRVQDYNRELAENHPVGITKDAATPLLQSADDALQSLNQDNELTLMRLNTLMQQRVQITTKASDQLASLNQCIQSILQNMRS